MLLSKKELGLEFPLTREYVYFNTAASGLVPQRTISCMQQFWQDAAYPYSLVASTRSRNGESTRQKMARFIGAGEDEVTFVTSTAHALSLVAACLPLGPKDEVLIPANEFPAVVYPFLHGQQTRGYSVKMLDWSEYGPSVEQIENAITPRTRVLALSWIQYLNGYTHDLALISEVCKKRGTILVVDAIQGLGAIPIDVKACGIDVMAAGSFKWLMAGTGLATLYVSRDVQPLLNPVMYNYKGNNTDALDPGFRLNLHPDIRKFELGSENHPGQRALGASVAFLESLGVQRISEHNSSLAQRIRLELIQLGYQVRTRQNEVSPIVTFSCGSREQDERLLAELEEHNVLTCLRGLGIRIAPHLYSTQEDVDRLVEVLTR